MKRNQYTLQMTIWANEIKELDKLYLTFKGHIPDIVKEMEQLLRTDDANVVMLYSRRCLEVIVTDLCETELNRPRKTEPLKGIIDKLNSEEKVPSHIITSMISLNSMATYGTHPKDFDPEQVKPVLNNLAIIIRWYLKYKDFKVVSKVNPQEEKKETRVVDDHLPVDMTIKRKKMPWNIKAAIGLVAIIVVVGIFNILKEKFDARDRNNERDWEGRTGDFTDERDGEYYKTIILGDQVWMAENLRAAVFNDGTPIELVTVDSVWCEFPSPAFCWQDNDRQAYKDSYGAIYNWHAVNTGMLCPVGWHVPSEEEWTTLTEFLGGQDIAGKKMKDASGLHWADSYEKVLRPTNESGFTALPGSSRGCTWEDQDSFGSLGYDCSLWSSTEDGNWAVRFFIQAGSNALFNESNNKSLGSYIRCVKD